jgi:hypothetical protein
MFARDDFPAARTGTPCPRKMPMIERLPRRIDDKADFHAQAVGSWFLGGSPDSRDDVIPETAHDFSVDLIVTPEQVIRCDNPRRPKGIVWDELKEDQIAAIPLLSRRRAAR